MSRHGARWDEQLLKLYRSITWAQGYEHDECTRGDGHSQEACGALDQALRVADQMGWGWPQHVPGRERQARK
ncbi:hypothetical protein ACWDYH_14915 [Nocardia goodfellowii]